METIYDFLKAQYLWLGRFRKVGIKKASTGEVDALSSTNQNKELALFETTRELSLDLKEVDENLTEKSEVINIISNFQPIGHEIKEIEKNKGFLYASVGALVAILFLVLLKFNRYLNNYKK